MVVLETVRLRLRRVTSADAPFLLGLVNEPSWIRAIGDRGIRTLEDTHAYIQRSYLGMYERYGHGLYLVETKAEGVAIGICGLIQRDGLSDVDLGYAFLPTYWGKGYAHEAAAAVMSYGRKEFGLKRLIAITALDNERSTHLLEKLGFRYHRTDRLIANGDESNFFVKDF